MPNSDFSPSLARSAGRTCVLCIGYSKLDRCLGATFLVSSSSVSARNSVRILREFYWKIVLRITLSLQSSLARAGTLSNSYLRVGAVSVPALKWSGCAWSTERRSLHANRSPSVFDTSDRFVSSSAWNKFKLNNFIFCSAFSPLFLPRSIVGGCAKRKERGRCQSSGGNCKQVSSADAKSVLKTANMYIFRIIRC